MSQGLYIFLAVVVMAVSTYLIRAIPIFFFRKEIKNRWFKSFLYYVPYSVLTAMTFPAIFTATGDTASSLAATVVALVLSFFRRSLVTVAAGAAAAALIVSLIF